MDRAHAASRRPASGRQPRRRRVVWLPRFAATRWRPGVASDGDWRRGGEPPRGTLRAARAPRRGRLHRRVRGPRNHGGVLMARAPGTAAALGAALGATRRGSGAVGLDRLRRRGHRSRGPRWGIRSRYAARCGSSGAAHTAFHAPRTAVALRAGGTGLDRARLDPGAAELRPLDLV